MSNEARTMSLEEQLAGLNKKYSQLCAELGHLITNQKKTAARIQEIESTIETLDQNAAILNRKLAIEKSTGKVLNEHAPLLEKLAKVDTESKASANLQAVPNEPA